MKHIIVGTNRPNSRSKEIALLVQQEYKALGEDTEIIDLADLPLKDLHGDDYGDNKPESLKNLTSKIDDSDGLIVIVPEYNGSMPGVLKLFIDYLSFPLAFEKRPVCFIGLGGRFGGLRPVEHLQQVFGYRNAYIFPFRVFLINVWNILKNGKVTEEETYQLIKDQARDFQKFTRALATEGLHANNR
jgi:NAD(P)H-dependent FMN reductase